MSKPKQWKQGRELKHADAWQPGDEIGIGPFDSVDELIAALEAPYPQEVELQRAAMQLNRDDMNAIFDGGATVASAMQAAYALGVELARKVKPLVWYPNGSGVYFWALGELYIVRALANGTYSATYAGIEDIDGDYLTEREAKSACQKHHEAFVLSQLEQV